MNHHRGYHAVPEEDGMGMGGSMEKEEMETEMGWMVGGVTDEELKALSDYRCFETMETCSIISNCLTLKYQVEVCFTMHTADSALTWWNLIEDIGVEAASPLIGVERIYGVQGYAARNAERIRKDDSNLRDNRVPQPHIQEAKTSGQQYWKTSTVQEGVSKMRHQNRGNPDIETRMVNNDWETDRVTEILDESLRPLGGGELNPIQNVVMRKRELRGILPYASHKGLGAVLMQREKVIAYASRQLKIRYHPRKGERGADALIEGKEASRYRFRAWFIDPIGFLTFRTDLSAQSKPERSRTIKAATVLRHRDGRKFAHPSAWLKRRRTSYSDVQSAVESIQEGPEYHLGALRPRMQKKSSPHLFTPLCTPLQMLRPKLIEDKASLK
ncbi:hypothetical protein Tco_0763745 [Tanacetum coccineum]